MVKDHLFLLEYRYDIFKYKLLLTILIINLVTRKNNAYNLSMLQIKIIKNNIVTILK